MPLVKSDMMGKQSAWGLWSITESEEELGFAALESVPEDIVAPAKRKEFLAGRALVRSLVELIGSEYSGIRKDEQGKPYLKDLPFEISLSHSSPYVAAQVHNGTAVGIDIEQPKEKLLRIAPRVLSRVEEVDAGEDIVKHCVYWCAKEAMYKLYGKRGLHFNTQLNVEPFDLERKGSLRGSIRNEIDVTLGYLIKDDYVLVYTIA